MYRTRKGKLRNKINSELIKEIPNLQNILTFVDEYESENLKTIDKLKRKKKNSLNNINGALKQCIDAHGPIDKSLIGSASKRIFGALLTDEYECDKRYSIRDVFIGVILGVIIMLLF